MLSSAARTVFCSMLLIACRPGCAQGLDPSNAPEVLHLATPSERFPAKWYPRVGDGTEVLPAPVTDRPYQAGIGQLSAKGDLIGTASDMEFQARDRFGRMRVDAEAGGMSIDGRAIKTKTVIVFDPVSHCSFHWMQAMIADLKLPPEERIAFVTCGPQTLRYKELDLMADAYAADFEAVQQSGDTTTKTERLPTLRMPGYTIDRWRFTTTHPNDTGQLISFTHENWYSPELKEILRMVDEEGSTGLTNIRLVDPDPTLFYPPGDYRIEIEAAR